MDIKKMLEEDWIHNLYYGESSLAEKMPETEEYLKVKYKLNSVYTLLLKEKELKEIMISLNESLLEKEGIEAEFEFKLGFKTAICLIMQGLEK